MKLRILFFIFISQSFFAQQVEKASYFDANYFTGNVILHKEDVAHLITGHPDGFLLSYNIKTLGDKEWHSIYNYPEYGISIQKLNFKNDILGSNYAVGLHYNFFFLKRSLMLRISQGIGITTNPYDKENNNKNNAFGSRILDNNYFLLQYQKQHLIGNIGLQAGLQLNHFSNARFKAPNSGINTFVAHVGLNYNFSERVVFQKDSVVSSKNFVERIKYNIAFRTGVSEGPVVGLGQRSFYHVGLYGDKRIGRKSAFQLGTDVFFSKYLQDYIAFSSVAFPDKKPVDPNVDYKRVAIFVGHELFINKLSLETQLGYYVYKPFKYEAGVYERLAVKYYIYKNYFTGFGLKAHGARAEAAEFTIGVRL